MSIKELLAVVTRDLAEYALSPQMLYRALIITVLGIVIIRLMMSLVRRLLRRAHSLTAVQGYVRTTIHIGLWLILALMVAGSLGVDVTSLIALLSVVGLALSLALQNTLSNLAGGLIILLSKPFAAQDYIEADGVAGTVSQIGLSYTTLITYDNKQVSIPNSQLASTKLTNFTTLGKRRVDVTVNVSYQSPAHAVKAAMSQVIAEIKQIHPDPAPVIWLAGYQENSVQYVARVWTNADDYWQVYYTLQEGIWPAFERHGVQMTYNHLNVHILNP